MFKGLFSWTPGHDTAEVTTEEKNAVEGNLNEFVTSHITEDMFENDAEKKNFFEYFNSRLQQEKIDIKKQSDDDKLSNSDKRKFKLYLLYLQAFIDYIEKLY